MTASPCAACAFYTETMNEHGAGIPRCRRFPPVFCSEPIQAFKVYHEGAAPPPPKVSPSILEMLAARHGEPEQPIGWHFPPAVSRCGEFAAAEAQG